MSAYLHQILLAFLFLNNNVHDFFWRAQKLTYNTVGILQGKMEHRCVTPINFDGIAISIEDQFMIETSRVLGYPDFIKTICENESMHIDVENKNIIWQFAQGTMQNRLINFEAYSVEICKLVIRALSKETRNRVRNVGTGRSLIFKKANEIIQDNYKDTLSINSLCKELNVSERNLRYAFKERSGVSPKKFIQSFKLNKVRRLLKSGNPDGIGEVANQLGFWHSGQFASDYKKMFGELPSERLKKRGH